MSTLEVLKAARELISDESRWCQEWYATTDDGHRADPWGASAARWCAVGAVRRADLDLEEEDETHALVVLERIAGEDVPDFNDTHTHAEVLALFDKAIAELEAA